MQPSEAKALVTIEGIYLPRLINSPEEGVFINVLKETECLQKINETVSNAISSMKVDGAIANIISESAPD